MSFNPPRHRRLPRRRPPPFPAGSSPAPSPPRNGPASPPTGAPHLARIADFDTVGAAFISHFHRALDMAPVRALRARGTPVLCWTVRSPAEEAAARARGATNVTFEGYLPDPG
ncbi:MAG: hypothetical protein KatS3mg118_2212 [Paracoccaceae bacterium]|nr:MAG: hypothetical protein KatS3mg118_2212 [Paracoccaceae bacterium]